MATQSPPSPILLRRRSVLERTGLSCSRLYDLMAQGEFPRPVELGPQSVAWVEAEVSSWIQTRINAPRRGVPSTQKGGRHG